MKIAIGLPSNRGFKARTVESLLNLEVGEKLVIPATEGYTISENRNYIVAKAIKGDCTHVLFIDDDMIFPPETLKKLLSHNKEIIGINAHSRMLPLKSTVQLLDGSVPQDVPKELFECMAVGGGILLINLEVFKNIKRPWFAMETHENGFTIMGEDSWFCRQARNKYSIWCDGSINVGHIGDFIY